MSAMRGLRYALKHQTMDCVVGGFTHTKDGLAVSSLLLGLFESNYENAQIMIADPTWDELETTY